MIGTKKANNIASLLFEGYHELDQSGKIPSLEVDQQGKISYVNPLMLKMIGKKEDEVIGEYLTNILEPASGNSRSFHYKWQAIQSGRPERANFILTSKHQRKYMILFRTAGKGTARDGFSEIIFSCEYITPIEEVVIKEEVLKNSFK